jgi:hypothetical protein
MLATTLDPDARRVILRESAWEHIKTDHAELSRHMREVMAAVREPDRRRRGRTAGEEWFALEHAGPARWLQVVVHYEGDEGWIVTAFPRTKLGW